LQGPARLFVAATRAASMPADRTLAVNDLEIRKLDGPPPLGFDCGREMQNSFLYSRAWDDQVERLSVTYLYFVGGILAAYATVCMDSLELGTREKIFKIRYRYVSALKLAQLGVHRSFQGLGLGKLVVADMIGFAQELAGQVGCRYLSLDAQPDLVAWYQGQGFRINKLMQRSSHSVSMRYDIGEAPAAHG
jgi:GNAT superfamily N-acetyltransferase